MCSNSASETNVHRYMGSGFWFNSITCLNILKGNKHNQIQNSGKKSNGSKCKYLSTKKNAKLTQDFAATKIQSAYRAYKARKALRRLKGILRFREEGHYSHSVEKQTISALNHIHLWSKIQAEIRARWLAMVIESRSTQKKLDNQFKLDAKLHQLEVEWNGGSENMEEILNKIQCRETAAAKRERTMAYAFSHQWRANSSQYFGQCYYDLSKESWGWSWKERWVAVRPWENRCQMRHSHFKKNRI
ncbi:hypothetical protein ABFS83_08G188200 [Erythranthe nasuta]